VMQEGRKEGREGRKVETNTNKQRRKERSI
jgi:hypothetical protein